MKKILSRLFLVAGCILALSGGAFAAGEEIFQVERGFKLVPAMIMLALLLVYIGVGFLSKVSTTSGYWVAGRGIGKFGNGAAIASDWMSAASFMGIAGLLYLKGAWGPTYLMGWTGGYLLLLTLVAAQIRRFGKFTIPEFLGDRYDTHGIRLITAAVTVIIAITYCTAQFKGIGLICGWIFGMNYTASVIFGAGVVCAYMLISGMSGVTRNQQIQYVVLISAFLVPLWILMKKAGGAGILPQLEYGNLISGFMEGKVAPGIDLASEQVESLKKAYLPWGKGDFYHMIAMLFSLMVGTAGLPHILIRFYTVKDENVARKSVIWGLFFIGLLYWSSPVYAALGMFWNPDGGKAVADVIILSAPEKAGLGMAFMGYLASGALAAGLSTVAGLLVAGASAVAHDWYATVYKPEANDREVLLVGRLFTAALCVIVVILALFPMALIAQIVAMVFSISGNTIFPALVLGIWYSKSNKYGAMAGMIFGLGMTLVAMVGWIYEVPLFSAGGLIPATSSAFIVCPLVFLINIAVSHLTAEKISAETARKTDMVMRKLHNLPGEVEDYDAKAGAFAH
ncbi:MAG: cation acetate symporter [Desulfuromonadales bacterium]|nr:cation acetate symporter [Desulfuromonadales bacterium]NIS39215.1 cation acetate symporter [Desulfuromonadales bacterium]